MKKTILLFITCVLSGHFLLHDTMAQSSMIGTTPTQRQLEGMQMTLGNMSFTAQPMEAPKSFREHDLVTVIVNKKWISTNKGAMERKKKMQNNYSITKWPSIHGLFGIGAAKLEDGAPALGYDINNKFKNEGSITRREQLEFQITCEVVSILENNVLYIVGTDEDTLSEEGKIIELSGYCRPQDIQPDNTIKGELIFSREIKEVSSGSAYDSYRRGWGQKLIDRYSPF